MNIKFHITDGPDDHKQVTVMLDDIVIARMILRSVEVYDLAIVLRGAADRLMKTGD